MLKAVGQALFSTGLQNPKYTEGEKKEGQDYEIRTYLATNWVSTTLSGMEWDAALSAGFRKLFKYIQGNNQNKVKVEMTAPRSIRTPPPQPSDPDVFVEQRKEFTAYVRTYGGFSNEKIKREELLKVIESLKRDAVQYVDHPFYVAGYDSPFKLTHRRNDVWILKKEQE
ncbi:hypothetical protein CgunFtcFv8_007314 [Champsocephalus gunnari]|uniref:Heme-binding protein 2 n=1 Tax=Champsocephalus gunnari TaxID=52237 RepID=A0AAN8CH98_CHAGU|nr:hypothetical protein CgunFtcFv8_007314 [Champsocephalus gunnari]